MTESNRSALDDLADTMLQLLDLDPDQRDEGRRRVLLVGLRKAYLEGVEVAAEGMMLANMLDDEEADTLPPPEGECLLTDAEQRELVDRFKRRDLPPPIVPSNAGCGHVPRPGVCADCQHPVGRCARDGCCVCHPSPRDLIEAALDGAQQR